MLRILVFVVVTFRNMSWCLDIEISDERLHWNELSTMNTTLLSKEYIVNNGWDVLKTRLQENELYWIGARGDYTRFVSWEGCVERNDSDEMCNLPKYKDYGSISKCIDNCPSNYVYFALQGDDCFCLPGEQRLYCVKNSSKECDKPCLKNPNDFCGGNNNVMTLYSKTKPDEVKKEIPSNSEGNCLILLYRNQTTTYRQQSCLENVRKYICKGPNSTYVEDNGSFITWQQAFDACRQKAESLYYNASYREEYDNSYSWTSLKRSIDLNWTTNTDGPRKCVAVTKTNSSTLAVMLEKCKKKLRYVYVTDHEDDSFEKEKSNSNTMIITILIIACIALSAVTGGLCFLRYQAKREDNAQTQPVCPVVTNSQRQTETPSRPSNPPFYNILEPCSGREPETSAGAHDVPTRPKQIYHTFAAVAQEEDTVYDSTSTSQNWNKRKQTKDGTIYGMRSADSCCNSVRHGNTAKKEIAPDIPNYYELAEF